MTNIYLMVGRSGSGKDTVVDYLCDRYGYKRINSYTTRPLRNAQDKHIFVSDKEFDELTNIVAYTDYGGYRYCATSEQVDGADLYIIDPSGVEYFRKNYHGNKGVKVIELWCTSMTARIRMLKRGDNAQNIAKRIDTDDAIFNDIESDLCVNAEFSKQTVATTIDDFIKECEK